MFKHCFYQTSTLRWKAVGEEEAVGDLHDRLYADMDSQGSSDQAESTSQSSCATVRSS